MKATVWTHFSVTDVPLRFPARATQVSVADYVTLTSSKVSSWDDQSVGGSCANPWTQTAAGSRPVVIAADTAFGGRPVLNFANSAWMTLAGAFAQPYSWFIVFQAPSDTDRTVIGALVDQTGDIAMYLGNPTIYAGTFCSFAGSYAAPVVMCATFDGANSGIWLSSRTPIGIATAGFGGVGSGINLGANLTPSGFLDGKIGCTARVPGKMSHIERNEIMQMLGQYYKINVT
jgi:hypothetical protein